MIVTMVEQLCTIFSIIAPHPKPDLGKNESDATRCNAMDGLGIYRKNSVKTQWLIVFQRYSS